MENENTLLETTMLHSIKSTLEQDEKNYIKQRNIFLNEISLDEEEQDYLSWNIKHFNVTWFLNMWDNYLNNYNIDQLFIIRDNGMLDYLIQSQNWRLVSRKYDMNDHKFVKVFQKWIAKDFANKYNKSIQ